MDKLKTYFKKLEKTKASDNYWLRFDARTQQSDQELSGIVELLYPEVSPGAIITEKSSENKILKHLESCLAYPHESASPAKDQATHVLKLAQEIVGSKQCIYIKLNSDEEEHPTPGIFWDFWYLVMPNSGANVLGVSGSACD